LVAQAGYAYLCEIAVRARVIYPVLAALGYFGSPTSSSATPSARRHGSTGMARHTRGATRS